METIVIGDSTVTVPAWLITDRLLLEAWMEWRADLCPACGHHLSTHAGKTYRDYKTHVDLTCPLVEARERDDAARRKKAGDKEAKPDDERWITRIYGLLKDMRKTNKHASELLAAPPEDL